MIYGPEIVALRGNLETIRERAIDLLADKQPTEAAALLLGALSQVQFTLGRFNDTCEGCERQLPNSGGHVDPFGGRWHELCWHYEQRRIRDSLGITPEDLAEPGPEVTA